jgi:serine/threonine protein kinase
MSQPPIVLLEGEQVGPYCVLELLDTGSRTIVYKAVDTGRNRYVALKVLRPRFAYGRYAARFEREAAVSGRLRHPHILGVEEHGNHQGTPYIVMPFIEGGTFRKRLYDEPPPPRSWALTLFLQICSALAYAHGLGIIHRDVKPSNVLLRDPDCALLTDFGVARLMDSPGMTLSGTILGTPEYMAPEQGLGATVDHRADLYSMGILLYRILAGHLPYTGSSPTAVMLQQVEAPVPTLAGPTVEVAAIWNRVLASALAKQPVDRYVSMDIFAAAVRATMQQERTLLGGQVPDILAPQTVPLGDLPTLHPSSDETTPVATPELPLS